MFAFGRYLGDFKMSNQYRNLKRAAKFYNCGIKPFEDVEHGLSSHQFDSAALIVSPNEVAFTGRRLGDFEMFWKMCYTLLT